MREPTGRSRFLPSKKGITLPLRLPVPRFSEFAFVEPQGAPDNQASGTMPGSTGSPGGHARPRAGGRQDHRGQSGDQHTSGQGTTGSAEARGPRRGLAAETVPLPA